MTLRGFRLQLQVELQSLDRPVVVADRVVGAPQVEEGRGKPVAAYKELLERLDRLLVVPIPPRLQSLFKELLYVLFTHVASLQTGGYHISISLW